MNTNAALTTVARRVQPWLQTKLSFSYFGRNSHRAWRFRTSTHPRRLLSPSSLKALERTFHFSRIFNPSAIRAPQRMLTTQSTLVSKQNTSIRRVVYLAWKENQPNGSYVFMKGCFDSIKGWTKLLESLNRIEKLELASPEGISRVRTNLSELRSYANNQFASKIAQKEQEDENNFYRIRRNREQAERVPTRFTSN